MLEMQRISRFVCLGRQLLLKDRLPAIPFFYVSIAAADQARTNVK